MSLKRAFLSCTLSLPLAACASADGAWRHQPENSDIGRIYTYERSNSDGSMSERVTVFRRDETHIEVYKSVGLCTGAALVTAEIDFESLSAPVITGGRLEPDAQHREFAFLEWDREAETLRILVQLPDMEMREEAAIESTPWHLFDFDLASLTVATPHLADPDAGFSFGMALAWADPSADDPLTWMGEVTAQFAGEEERLGASTRRYELTGSAFDAENAVADTGQLWLDAEDGHVVEASFPVPNHPGYTDFSLRLLNVSDGGAEEWTQLLRDHYEGCED